MHRLEKIIKAIEDGAVVVTVNKRLARYLSARYEASMLAKGSGAWASPMVMPLSSWAKNLLEDSWQEGRAALVSDVRAAALWKQIIEKDVTGRKILLADGSWRAAYSAYCLMKEYCLKGLGEEIYLSPEALAFKRWSREYDRALGRLGFMDYSGLLGVVSKALESSEVEPPAKVVFAGFDEVTPERAVFVRALQKAGTELRHWPSEPRLIGEGEGFLPDDIDGRVGLRVFKDMTEEVRACARWLRRLASSEKSGVRVGVIVPELDKYREVIIREFRAELSPASMLPWENIQDVFNVSLGSPLAGEPLVKSALDILSAGLWADDISKVSAVLLSPFIGLSEGERLVLASLDAELKDRKVLRLGLRELRDGFVRREGAALKGFSTALDKWIELLESDKDAVLPGVWAERFSSILTALGRQSGGDALTSREFQTLESWKVLLAEFAGLGDIIGVISRANAIARIRAMANEKPFQIEDVSGDAASKIVGIEVLGLLEASGQGFDYVWLMGMHDGALPGPCAPNPFIPIELQRRFAMPRATPERMLGFAMVALKRVFESAQDFVVSYPKELDGKEVGLSPLLKGVKDAKEDTEKKDNGHSLKAVTHRAFALEDMPLDGNIALSGSEASAFKGGTSVIKDQSECPFRAFAKHRLGARAINLPEDGLDAAERGTIVHKALEVFWREVKSSARLRELKESGELGALISSAVQDGRKGFYSRRLSRRLIDMEGERVESLVAEWLELELRRAPFTVVQTEFDEKVSIGGLSISARPDRLDELEGGAKVVIDYKTGKCTKDGWLPDKLTEPQMLLYGIGTDFDAVAFASLKLPGVRFVGLSRDDEMLPNVKSLDKENKWREKMEGVRNWNDLMDRWREELTSIAQCFVEGRSSVAPSSPQACKYCELQLFCRIFEADKGGRGEEAAANE